MKYKLSFNNYKILKEILDSKFVWNMISFVIGFYDKVKVYYMFDIMVIGDYGIK